LAGIIHASSNLHATATDRFPNFVYGDNLSVNDNRNSGILSGKVFESACIFGLKCGMQRSELVVAAIQFGGAAELERHILAESNRYVHHGAALSSVSSVVLEDVVRPRDGVSGLECVGFRQRGIDTIGQRSVFVNLCFREIERWRPPYASTQLSKDQCPRAQQNDPSLASQMHVFVPDAIAVC
jgi:hypothetical protein